MTPGVVLAGRIELVSLLVEDPEVRSFRAREFPGPKPVLAHMLKLVPATALHESLSQLVARRRSLVREVIEHEGTQYVVTDAPEKFFSLRRMLQESSPAPTPQGAEQFTRAGMWTVPGSPASHPEPEESAATKTRAVTVLSSPPVRTPQATPPAPPPPAPAASAPGEFTQMFQTQRSTAPRAAPTFVPPPPPPPIPTEALGPRESGEFTKMFQAQPARRPAPAVEPVFSPAPAAPPSGPGEFTTFFQSPPASTPSEPGPQAPMIPPPAPAQQPGEYTLMFQTPPAAGMSASPGSATDVFATPPARPFPPPAPLVRGPGDFTMGIQGGGAAAPIRTPAPAQPLPVAARPVPPRPVPPRPAKSGVPAWLVAGIAASAVILLVVLVAVFLKRL